MPVMKKCCLTFLKLCIFVLCLNGIANWCNEKTDGFSVARIHSELSFNPAWETTPLKAKEQEELNEALNQKFHYLGCGGQCFAFRSEDDRYVIKFFKHRIRKPWTLILGFPLPRVLDDKRRRKYEKADFKLNRDFTSYKIAFEDLREETGLLYIHLNKGISLNRTLSVTDKIGITHSIALDDVEFVVQKKAQMAYARFDDLGRKGNTAETKKTLRALLDLIVIRCKKGIYDEDPRLHRNFGFVGDQPIFIDVGRFVKDLSRKNPEVYKKDLHLITKRLRAWLQDTHPAFVMTLDEELQLYASMD